MRKYLLIFVIIALLLPCFTACDTAPRIVNLTLDGDLADALEQVADGGTIRIETRYNIPNNFIWEEHEKSITITGGMLNFKNNKDFVLGDGVRFENITLQFEDNSNLYANGHPLYIHTDVKVSGLANLYGGGRLSNVSGTNMTLLGGTFLNVYGGGNSGKVNGDVHLVIGGNFNSKMGAISHTHEYQIFGGGNNCVINGNVNLTFGENAKANYIYGGCQGKNSRIRGSIRLNFNGGQAMSVIGGSYDVNQQSDVHLSFTGGQVQQIFGGCEKASMAGNILLSITGGTVTRRIYGGCYNNYTLDGWQDVPNYVYGTILLVLGENVDLKLDYGSDESVYAHSRQATIPTTEISHLAFTSEAAQAKHKSKLGAQDWTMQSIMGSTKICDKQHILTFNATDKAIVQNCDQHKSPIASFSVINGIFTGQPPENVTVTVDENWIGPAPYVVYENNTNIGFATATIRFGDMSKTVTFFIWPPVWVCITAGVVLLLITAGVILVIMKKKKAAT